MGGKSSIGRHKCENPRTKIRRCWQKIVTCFPRPRRVFHRRKQLQEELHGQRYCLSSRGCLPKNYGIPAVLEIQPVVFPRFEKFGSFAKIPQFVQNDTKHVFTTRIDLIYNQCGAKCCFNKYTAVYGRFGVLNASMYV